MCRIATVQAKLKFEQETVWQWIAVGNYVQAQTVDARPFSLSFSGLAMRLVLLLLQNTPQSLPTLSFQWNKLFTNSYSSACWNLVVSSKNEFVWTKLMYGLCYTVHQCFLAFKMAANITELSGFLPANCSNSASALRIDIPQIMSEHSLLLAGAVNNENSFRSE